MANTTIQLGDITLDVAVELIRALSIGHERHSSAWRASVEWGSGFSAAAATAFDVDRDDPRESLLDALGTCVSLGLAADAALADEPIRGLRFDLAGESVAASVTLGIEPCVETLADVWRRAG